MTWRGDTTIGDRILACLPYALFLYDGIPFSNSLIQAVPVLVPILRPIVTPVAVLENTIPFGSLIIFFGLFFFVVRNERIKHFIRFNTMQALLLSIGLFLIGLILSLFPGLGTLDFLMIGINSAIFLAVLCAFIFAIVQTLRGLYADLPAVSEAVYAQVR